MDATTIVGRDDELGVLQAFLAGSERGPSALLLSGEPGIGKTVLWEAVIASARDGAGRVLSCRGVEAEASFGFAGLSELLAGMLDEVGEALAPPRRRALEVALLLAEPGEQSPDAHAIGLALLDVLRALAEPGPVLVALDDVQWLDASSAAVLQVAMRRWPEPPALGQAPDEVTDPVLTMLFGVTSQRIEDWLGSPEGAGALAGVARSKGIAEGTARVILEPEHLGSLREGEILVAPSTSPSWTPVFGRASGAVTDIGGIMSHAAIVAREYGLPAVLGIGTATKKIKTGDRLRVDGDAGVVTILD